MSSFTTDTRARARRRGLASTPRCGAGIPSALRFRTPVDRAPAAVGRRRARERRVSRPHLPRRTESSRAFARPAGLGLRALYTDAGIGVLHSRAPGTPAPLTARRPELRARPQSAAFAESVASVRSRVVGLIRHVTVLGSCLVHEQTTKLRRTAAVKFALWIGQFPQPAVVRVPEEHIPAAGVSSKFLEVCADEHVYADARVVRDDAPLGHIPCANQKGFSSPDLHRACPTVGTGVFGMTDSSAPPSVRRHETWYPPAPVRRFASTAEVIIRLALDGRKAALLDGAIVAVAAPALAAGHPPRSRIACSPRWRFILPDEVKQAVATASYPSGARGCSICIRSSCTRDPRRQDAAVDAGRAFPERDLEQADASVSVEHAQAHRRGSREGAT